MLNEKVNTKMKHGIQMDSLKDFCGERESSIWCTDTIHYAIQHVRKEIIFL